MRWLAAVAALIVLGLAGPARSEPPARLAFEVWREGSPMGRHTLDFTRQGERLEVAIAIDLSVGLGPITLYRYRHRSQEVWQSGRLVGLATETNDDGDAVTVSARSTPDGLTVEAGGAARTLPALTVPTSYWHRAVLDRAEMLDSQDGRTRRLTITPLGREDIEVAGRATAADRFRISGDLEMDLWYLPNGDWAGLEFTAKGSKITYRRQTPAEVAVVPDGLAPDPADAVGVLP